MRNLLFISAVGLSLCILLACGQTSSTSEPQGESAPTAKAAPSESKLQIQLDRFEKVIADYEAADKENPVSKGEVLFTGSSSIRMWKSLKEDMAGMPVHNRGFGGSTLPEVIHFADRIVFPYEPKIIMLYCGENDISAGASAEESVTSFEKFAGMVREKLPSTKLTFLAMKPSVARWNLWPEYQKANAAIKALTKQDDLLDYIAIDEPMLDANGMIDSTIFIKDMLQLHMNAEGYKRWTAIVQPYLTKQLRK